MKLNLTLLFLIISQIIFSQQYDSVVYDKEKPDANNEIYKTGKVYIFDYEIIYKGIRHKLKKNNGMFASNDFELATIGADSIMVDKIHLIVQPILEANSSNENQTQISYIEEPAYQSFHSTGLVENEENIWIHPIRKAFFNSLETAPFPFVKKPLKTGLEWKDEMKIGQGWRNEMWGTWDGQLLLTYDYRITGKVTLTTEIGELDCFIIESSANSTIGETKLKSYFSETYGFVRLEYELLNNLEVNFWLVDYKTGKKFNDMRTFYQTKEYIKQ